MKLVVRFITEPESSQEGSNQYSDYHVDPDEKPTGLHWMLSCSNQIQV